MASAAIGGRRSRAAGTLVIDVDGLGMPDQAQGLSGR